MDNDEEILDAGSRKLFAKPWSELVKDFERIGQSPSANFVAAVMAAGALELSKARASSEDRPGLSASSDIPNDAIEERAHQLLKEEKAKVDTPGEILPGGQEMVKNPTPEEGAQTADSERQDLEAMRAMTGLPSPAYAADKYEWTRAQQYWKLPPEPPDLPPPSSQERQLRKGRVIIGLTTFAAIIATIGVPLAIFDKFGFLLAGVAATAGYFVSRAYYQVWEAVGRAVDRLENERWEERRLQLEGKVRVIVKESAHEDSPPPLQRS